MSPPLKLRLRVVAPRITQDLRGLYAVSMVYHGDISIVKVEAILEFENPINGTWRPVEVAHDQQD